MERQTASTVAHFHRLCADKGLSHTHQRQVIYEALAEMGDHPSPEAIYEVVKERIPSISLATVYKNIKTFVEHGLISEVSLHHGLTRLETNMHPHHHLICSRCKSIIDVEDDSFGPVRLIRPAPEGFQVQRYCVEVIGICEDCAG